MNGPGTGIVNDLRRRILLLDLAPGAPLSRAELSTRYGISSTPLRDALLKLQDEGLVQVLPQSRTTVSRIDLDQARQIHVLRSAVETEIASRLALAPPPGLVEQLEELLAIHHEEARKGDMVAFTQIDLAFHETLFHAAGLMHVHQVIRRESVHIDRLRALHLMQPDKAQQIMADHQSIVETIASGSCASAGEAMRRHLSQSILWGERMTDQHPEFFVSG